MEQFSLGGNGREKFGVLTIGLVNNMPDAAMRATELQFARLLKESAGAMDVRLKLFSLGDVERSEEMRARMAGFYADAAALPDAGIDALIVTGSEARAPDLRSEPYWHALKNLIDWAETDTISTVFSCLAAHAAVLHLDGIERAPLPQKLRGVFECERVEEDPLLLGVSPVLSMPHSRHNGLAESALSGSGYRVLSRIPDGDADIFVRQGRSLMLFLQGHPEQDADSLGREFLHDTALFLRGEGAERPAMPENYFDRATENTLHELAGHAIDPAIVPRYRAVVSGAVPLHSWRGAAVRLFANWLTLVAAAKARRAASRSVHTRRRAS
jgi:homoserine O-succinyltransferase